MDNVMNTIGTILLFAFMLGMGFFYVKNLLKLRIALKEQDYTLITILRIFGVFTFFLGVVMGFV